MLIDVTKNETTGKYEVETDVKPTPAPGGGAIAYAWNFENDLGGTGIAYFNFDVAPEDIIEFETKRSITLSGSSSPYVEIYPCNYSGYSKQSNTQFYINRGRDGATYTRADSSEDINIWEYQPTSGGGDEVED